MDKIRLSTADIEFILQWRDEHKDLVRLGMSPLKAVKIVCFESGYTITAVRDGKLLNFGINQLGMSLGKLVFETLDNGMCELVKNTTKLQSEERQAVLTVYSSAMALLIFGRATIRQDVRDVREIVSKKPKKASNKSKRPGYTYILGRSGNEPHLMVKGSHSSPSGMFSVRGHFRHYKNGKVIWITEYTKGCGKKKDKTFKVGRRGNMGEKKWTELLSSSVYSRLANCYSTKEDVLPLAQARWAWLKRIKATGYCKEDALIYVLELLDCNSVNVDLTREEYDDILNSII